MRYYIVLLVIFGFSYNALGASSSSTPGGFELEDRVASKSHIPPFSSDLCSLAVERSTPEGYRRWILTTASTTLPFPDDGLGVDDYGRTREEAQESARQIYVAAVRKSEEAIRKAETYRRRIIHAAWQAAEAKRKEEAAYHRRMLDPVGNLLSEDERAKTQKNRRLIYAAWRRAQGGSSCH